MPIFCHFWVQGCCSPFLWNPCFLPLWGTIFFSASCFLLCFLIFSLFYISSFPSSQCLPIALFLFFSLSLLSFCIFGSILYLSLGVIFLVFIQPQRYFLVGFAWPRRGENCQNLWARGNLKRQLTWPLFSLLGVSCTHESEHYPCTVGYSSPKFPSHLGSRCLENECQWWARAQRSSAGCCQEWTHSFASCLLSFLSFWPWTPTPDSPMWQSLSSCGLR